MCGGGLSRRDNHAPLHLGGCGSLVREGQMPIPDSSRCVLKCVLKCPWARYWARCCPSFSFDYVEDDDDDRSV